MHRTPRGADTRRVAPAACAARRGSSPAARRRPRRARSTRARRSSAASAAWARAGGVRLVVLAASLLGARAASSASRSSRPRSWLARARAAAGAPRARRRRAGGAARAARCSSTSRSRCSRGRSGAIPAHGAISMALCSSAIARPPSTARARYAPICWPRRRAPRARAGVVRPRSALAALAPRCAREPRRAPAALRLVPRLARRRDLRARRARRGCASLVARRCAIAPAPAAARGWRVAMRRSRVGRGGLLGLRRQPGPPLRRLRAHGDDGAGAARACRCRWRRARVAGAERQAAERRCRRCPTGPRRPDADVVVITIDALRADHVGAYGYKRATTPHIDALAAQRRPLRARLRPGAAHVVLGGVDADRQVLPDAGAPRARASATTRSPTVLRNYGWRTAAFYPPSVFYVDAHEAEGLRGHALRLRVREVRVPGRRAPRRPDRSPTSTRSSPRRRSSGCTSSSRTSPTRRTPASPSAPPTSIATTARSPTSTRAVGRLIAYLHARRPGAIVIIARRSRRGVRRARRALPRLHALRRAAAHPADRRGPGRVAARGRRAGRAHRRHADGAEPARHPRAGAHARHRPRPLAGDAARAIPTACRRPSPRSRTSGWSCGARRSSSAI